MIRKLVCTILALGTVAVLAAPAAAAEETGSIRVTLQNGETVVPDGAVSLYRVGSLVDGDFWLTEEFGGGIIQQEDALSPALAGWLAETAEGGTQQELDEEGSAAFSGLPAGLYLLVQTVRSTGYHRMEPMTVMIPCQYQWHVQAYPKTQEIIYEIPSTGQPLAPYVGAAGMVLSSGGLLLCGVKKRRP